LFCAPIFSRQKYSSTKEENIFDIPIGVVVTDIDAHAMWLLKNVDWYFVAARNAGLSGGFGHPSETILSQGSDRSDLWSGKTQA